MTSRPKAARPAAPASTPTEALQIAVIGAGSPGLVTAAGLASFGHQVAVCDADETRIERLCRLALPMLEEGLADLLRSQVAAGRLRFGSDPIEALRPADIVFIAVDTPARPDGTTDLRALDVARRHITETLRAPALVVLKSTAPVGTAHQLQIDLNESMGVGESAPEVLSCPDFLREGTAVADFMKPDRIVIGDDGPAGRGQALLMSAFAPIVAAGVPVIGMDTRSAELTQCAASAMRAARISFINEIAALASVTGADIERVREGLGSDPGLGGGCLRPGLGYGGPSLGKDVAALRETARRHNLRSDMLQATERVNSRQRCWAFDALCRDLGSREALRGLRVAVWGLAYRPGTDALTESPSLALIDRLWRAGALLSLYDPAALDSARASIVSSRRIRFATSAQDALKQAAVLVHVTEWPEFLAFDPAQAEGLAGLRTVYDGRNALDAARWEAAGVQVVQVGRPTHAPRRSRSGASGQVALAVQMG